MIRKLLPTLMVLLLCGFIPLGAQSSLKKAEKQYDLKAFELAAYNYNVALQEDSENADIMIKMAMCFHNMSNDLDAVNFFREAASRTELNENELLSYGKALKKLGNYNIARDQFTLLAESNPVVGNHYLLSCNYAEKLLKEPIGYELQTFGGNTTMSDFSPVAFGDFWVFTSFRNDLIDKSKIDEKVPGTRLYATGQIAGKFNSVAPLRLPFRDSYRYGSISYSEDLTSCAVMKNNFKESYIPVFQDDEDNSIVLADVDMDGDFINEVSFAYNELGSSTAFPCLAFNGLALYFSSNREGGYGGYDLYSSYKKDGEWTLPENLGPAINTPGNEITPYFDDHTLYFASDYIHGLGGYDLFQSEVYNGQWTFPANMGNGVNSISDDLYPYVSKITGKIYFSSNRLGTKGGLDIYVAYEREATPLASVVLEPQVPMAAPVTFGEALSEVGMPQVKTVSNQNDILNSPKKVEEFEQASDAFASDKNIIDLAVSSTEATATETNEEKINKEAIPKAFVLPKTTNDLPYRMSPSNWEGARMVALNENFLTGTKVYFIQLAALSRSTAKATKFVGLSKYGNIYTVDQKNLTKVRLGYFLDEDQAREVLRSIKKYGYKDAFITYQALNTSEMELLLSNSNENKSDTYMVPSKFKGQSSYKVRLASYEDPIWFDVSKVKNLGKIEQWTKGGWTIFILSGFDSKNAAEKARIGAVNKGFADAEVVLDNNGILERIKKN